MECPVCFSEIAEGSKFCSNCGYEVGFENQLNPKRIKAHITQFRLPNFVEEVEITGYDCPICGYPIVRSIGEYGPFCACSKYPICKFACDEEELEELTKNPLPDCPLCDGKILPRKGRYGKFYGCSNYPKCRFTCQEDEIDGIHEKNYEKCPNCNGHLLLKTGKNGQYYGCTDCSFTCEVEEIENINEKNYERCPVCNGILVRRKGTDGEFISCANYPRCDYSRY